jgi:hypothetical protein
LKLLVDRLLGPNADRAIVEQILRMRASGQRPAFAFRADERVLRPRVAGFIAVGGALTPQWKTLALPTMHLLTFSMQIAVADQFVIAGAGTPKSVVLDTEALSRAAKLGVNVASQMGRTFDFARAICRMRNLRCTGQLGDDFEIEWTDLTTSVITMREKRSHYEEILDTAQRHSTLQDAITERAAAYLDYHPIMRPGAR